MAKITIELDTNECREDIKILRALAGAYDEIGYTDAASEAYRAVVESDEPKVGPTPASTGIEAEVEKARRTRRTKAQIEADNAVAEPATTGSTTTSATPGTTDGAGAGLTAPTSASPYNGATPAPEVVNGLLGKMMQSGKFTAAKLQEVVIEASDKKFMSVKQAAQTPEGLAYMPAMYEGLLALQATVADA